MSVTTPLRRQMRKERDLRPWRSLTPERIRAARTSLGLTQADFAILIGRVEGRGIAPDWSKISRWERGIRKPGTLWGPAILKIVLREEARMMQHDSTTHRAMD